MRKPGNYSQEMPKVVVSRDANLLFGKFYDLLIASDAIQRPDCP